MSAHRIVRDLFLAHTPYDIPDPGDAGTIIVDRQFGICKMTSGSGAQTRTLPVPDKANIYVLLNLVTDGGADITVTVTSGYDQAANTALVFGDVGDMAMLVSVPISTSAYRYRLVAADGLTVATADAVTAQTITTLTSTTAGLDTATINTLKLKVSAVTAANSAINNAAPLFFGFNQVTGANNTTAVILPIAATGGVVLVKNATNGKTLPVFPQVNSDIEFLGANNAFTMLNGVAGTGTVFVATNTTHWETLPAVAS